MGQNLTQASAGSTANGVVTGSITGTTMTVTAVASGALGARRYDHWDRGCDWNLSDGRWHRYARHRTYTASASQTVSNTTITAPSVTWDFTGGSSVLYLDSATMRWMFPGQGFTLTTGSGTSPYTVTGVYRYLGYIIAIRADQNAGGPLGSLYDTSDTLYSSPSGCPIGQAPYSWTAS